MSQASSSPPDFVSPPLTPGARRVMEEVEKKRKREMEEKEKEKKGGREGGKKRVRRLKKAQHAQYPARANFDDAYACQDTEYQLMLLEDPDGLQWSGMGEIPPQLREFVGSHRLRRY